MLKKSSTHNPRDPRPAARGRTTASPRSAALALALVFASSGCATLPPPATTSGHAKGSRAEQVFLYQSRVADALLDRYPLLSIFDDADPALVDAEARMTESCSALTRAVIAEIEGERPSLGLRFRVLTSLDDCERAARRIEHLLDVQSADGGHNTQSI
jgi:hypothetical protein